MKKEDTRTFCAHEQEDKAVPADRKKECTPFPAIGGAVALVAAMALVVGLSLYAVQDLREEVATLHTPEPEPEVELAWAPPPVSTRTQVLE